MAFVATMATMRELMREHRITARSIPEVTGEMEAQISRYGGSRRVKFRGRKLSNEAFINAAILHVLRLPPEAQELAIAGAVAELESILSDAPGPEVRAAAKPQIVEPPRHARRKKSG